MTVMRDLQQQIAQLVCSVYFHAIKVLYSQSVLTAVCVDDCTLNTLEDDGTGIIEEKAPTDNKVAANSTNSTVTVDDCKRRRNGVCALRKDPDTGVYTSCVSWDLDSGKCNLYKEGVFR